MHPVRDPRLDEWRRWQFRNAESTIDDRDRVLTAFANFIGGQPSRATTDDVVNYLGSIRHLRPSTKATYFGHVKAWFGWLVWMDYREDNPCAKVLAPKFPRRQPRPVSEAQFRRLLDTRMHRRCRTMIVLAAFQGLRVHEIAKLRGEDLDLIDGTLRVIGKGDSDRTLPLHSLVAAEARFYPVRGFWFASYVGNRRGSGPVLANSVSNTISQAMTRAKIPGGAHRLRHWYASELVEEGVDIRIVQELLRHASLQSTQIYTRVTIKQQRHAIGLLRPPAENDKTGPTIAA